MVVPDWLAQAVRPKRAPVSRPDMARAAVAICAPLAVGLALGKGTIGSLPAMGGLLGTVADNGGPYPTRVKRVVSATVFGGAVGLTLGSVIHGHGWTAVIVLVLVAAVSGTLSAGGDIGSITGLQLLVYTAVGLGPVGQQRPEWHTVAGFTAGAAWALLLTVPGWLHAPHGKETRDVAAVYDALARKLAAVGTKQFTARRQDVTATLNTAYDEVLTARARVSGRNPDMMRLVALLNASQLVAEASTALGLASDRPPPLVITTLRRIAETIRAGGDAPFAPPAWDHSSGALALRDALADAISALSGSWSPTDQRKRQRPPLTLLERLAGGRVGHQFTLRLTTCVLVAGVVTEVLSLSRSYWVPLTVAVVFKPDYGSVLIRGLQRGIGTIVGAVLGAMLLITVHGLWLLVPFAVLAALLPYGRARNYGLMTTFLTPLVVVLIDLNHPATWDLAEARLLDTLLGCGIVLVAGFAPWWTSWYVHLPRQFAITAGQVRDYLLAALADDEAGSAPSGGTPLPDRSRLRRRTYRAIADLRAEFQRTMSEPPAVSRPASAWWPALVGLELVMDATTAVSLEVSRKGVPAPSPEAVRTLATVLWNACSAAAIGAALPDSWEASLPADDVLKPVTAAVRTLLGVLGKGEERLTLSGWPDSNRRPPRPKRGALAKLRYSPSRQL